LAEQKTFNAWWGLYSQSMIGAVNNLEDNLIWQDYFKKTGIRIKFYHPPFGKEAENFNLAIASGDLSDIFHVLYYNGTVPSYPGGWDKAIEDKAIIRLNELLPKYAPNYYKMLKSNPDIYKTLLTPGGSIVCIAPIADVWKPWGGLYIRKDWLDEFKLPVPVTYNDWYRVLKTFKDKKGAVMQLLYVGFHMYDAFNAGYNAPYGFYQVNGTVKHGLLENGMREYLSMMNKWYKEGLIDKDFYAVRDYYPKESAVISGKYGAFFSYNGFAYYETLGKSKDPKFELIAVAPPVKKKGDKLHIGQRVRNMYVNLTGPAVFITTKCKEPETILKFFDYFYSPEGSIYWTYGIEGKTFVYENNKPKFTDLAASGGRTPYNWNCVLSGGFGYQKDRDAANPNMSKKEYEAGFVWGSNNDGAYGLPDSLPFTKEEQEKVSKIMTDVTTYAEENIPKFITGAIPLSQYSKFISQLKKIGLEEVVKIYQNAYDRYQGIKVGD